MKTNRISIKKHKDFYYVSGGPWKVVRTLSKSEANTIANARREVLKARKKRLTKK